ncbi:site-specific DNA-methyltransferase [Geobacillus thermodenitrificans]|uniref:DNA-methyltransferase n=1 Tax=Geobacillus thermodenitrificans TaxID=33940 RepID=UPI003D1BE995
MKETGSLSIPNPFQRYPIYLTLHKILDGTDCEFIIFFRKGKSVPIHNLGDSQYQDHTYEEDDYYNDNEIWEEKVIECQNINGKDKLHPTQKPVKLLEKLILNSSSKGQLVFDPFMGSGSTAIAAINTNRKFLGFEIDEKYYKVSQERIRNKIS